MCTRWAQAQRMNPRETLALERASRASRASRAKRAAVKLTIKETNYFFLESKGEFSVAESEFESVLGVSAGASVNAIVTASVVRV